jgi:hypothetical protein
MLASTLLPLMQKPPVALTPLELLLICDSSVSMRSPFVVSS